MWHNGNYQVYQNATQAPPPPSLPNAGAFTNNNNRSLPRRQPQLSALEMNELEEFKITYGVRGTWDTYQTYRRTGVFPNRPDMTFVPVARPVAVQGPVYTGGAAISSWRPQGNSQAAYAIAHLPPVPQHTSATAQRGLQAPVRPTLEASNDTEHEDAIWIPIHYHPVAQRAAKTAQRSSRYTTPSPHALLTEQGLYEMDGRIVGAGPSGTNSRGRNGRNSDSAANTNSTTVVARATSASAPPESTPDNIIGSNDVPLDAANPPHDNPGRLVLRLRPIARPVLVKAGRSASHEEHTAITEDANTSSVPQLRPEQAAGRQPTTRPISVEPVCLTCQTLGRTYLRCRIGDSTPEPATGQPASFGPIARPCPVTVNARVELTATSTVTQTDQVSVNQSRTPSLNRTQIFNRALGLTLRVPDETPHTSRSVSLRSLQPTPPPEENETGHAEQTVPANPPDTPASPPPSAPNEQPDQMSQFHLPTDLPESDSESNTPTSPTPPCGSSPSSAPWSNPSIQLWNFRVLQALAPPANATPPQDPLCHYHVDTSIVPTGAINTSRVTEILPSPWHAYTSLGMYAQALRKLHPIQIPQIIRAVEAVVVHCHSLAPGYSHGAITWENIWVEVKPAPEVKSRFIKKGIIKVDRPEWEVRKVVVGCVKERGLPCRREPSDMSMVAEVKRWLNRSLEEDEEVERGRVREVEKEEESARREVRGRSLSSADSRERDTSPSSDDPADSTEGKTDPTPPKLLGPTESQSSGHSDFATASSSSHDAAEKQTDSSSGWTRGCIVPARQDWLRRHRRSYQKTWLLRRAERAKRWHMAKRYWVAATC